jgi:hypothetical protein
LPVARAASKRFGLLMTFTDESLATAKPNVNWAILAPALPSQSRNALFAFLAPWRAKFFLFLPPQNPVPNYFTLINQQLTHQPVNRPATLTPDETHANHPQLPHPPHNRARKPKPASRRTRHPRRPKTLISIRTWIFL